MDETKHYQAQIRQDDHLETVTFETDGDPVRYLWERYGMRTYIASLEETEPDTSDDN